MTRYLKIMSFTLGTMVVVGGAMVEVVDGDTVVDGALDTEAGDGAQDTTVGGGAQDTEAVVAGAVEVDPADHQEDHEPLQVEFLLLAY